jgi:hypothetical protein
MSDEREMEKISGDRWGFEPQLPPRENGYNTLPQPRVNPLQHPRPRA